jgi:hypothetical protein
MSHRTTMIVCEILLVVVGVWRLVLAKLGRGDDGRPLLKPQIVYYKVIGSTLVIGNVVLLALWLLL